VATLPWAPEISAPQRVQKREPGDIGWPHFGQVAGLAAGMGPKI